MNSIGNKKNKYSILTALLLLVVLSSLLPLIIAGAYDVPSNDDYSFAVDAHLAYIKTGSVWQAMKGAYGQAVTSYWNWQGTYSAIFLMALQPAVFGFRFYRLTPILMLLSLLIGIFSLLISIFDRVFHCGKTVGVISAAIAALLCIQMMPSPVEGLYWYNGAIYYTFFHGVAMLSFSLMIEYIYAGGKGKWVALLLLELFLAGGNYSTALCSAIVWSLTILILIVKKNRSWKGLLVPFFVFLIAFAANILAPGNAVRQGGMTHVPNVFWDIIASFRDGARFGLRWSRLPLLGAAGFLGVVFWNEFDECDFRFPLPAVVTIFSFCLFSAMFCPPEYAMGSSGPLRLKNIQYYTYVMLVLINVCYWIGWVSGRRKRDRKKRNTMLIAGAGCLWLALAIVFLRNGAYTSVAAIGVLSSGEARTYYQAAEDRLSVLEDPSILTVELPPYPCTPFLLYHGDVTTDPQHYVNEGVAQFYGKTSVVLETGE